MKSNQSHHLNTDDLAFSAYLKMKGHSLTKLDHIKSKSIFFFDIGDLDANQLKIEFANSDFSRFYHELRNLKKLV